jgi:hypothetical protein
MTIRQQGGIFGRNPSFNDVEAATVNVDTTTDNAVIGQFALWDSTQSAQPYLRMAHSLGTSIGSHTAITLNDMLGSVAFAGSTGTAFYDGASVEGKATQTYTGSNGGTKLLFKTTPNGSQTLTEQMVLDQGGDLTISNGNLVIGTSGKGIDFSATSGTGTSELFSDYEEGTYTATLYDASSGGNASATTTTGYYTKIGRTVHVTFGPLNNINTSGMTSGNALRISLPFAAGQSAAGVLITDQLDFTAGKTAVYPMVAASSDRMTVIETGDGVADGQVPVSAISSGVTDIGRMTVTYIV